MRALVTGGGGFLGSHLVERLARGRARRLRRAAARLRPDLDGRRGAALRRRRPELVFHLAAEVGGIGANRANPGRYWYANLHDGRPRARAEPASHGTAKLVTLGTICAYPKLTPVPFSEDDLWNGYPEETNAPYGIAKKALLVGGQAYREQYGLERRLPAPGRTSTARGDNFDLATSHVIPASDPEDARVARARSCSSATARRLASSSTSTTLSRGSCSRPSATTAPSR